MTLKSLNLNCKITPWFSFSKKQNIQPEEFQSTPNTGVPFKAEFGMGVGAALTTYGAQQVYSRYISPWNSVANSSEQNEEMPKDSNTKYTEKDSLKFVSDGNKNIEKQCAGVGFNLLTTCVFEDQPNIKKTMAKEVSSLLFNFLPKGSTLNIEKTKMGNNSQTQSKMTMNFSMPTANLNVNAEILKDDIKVKGTQGIETTSSKVTSNVSYKYGDNTGELSGQARKLEIKDLKKRDTFISGNLLANINEETMKMEVKSKAWMLTDGNGFSNEFSAKIENNDEILCQANLKAKGQCLDGNISGNISGSMETTDEIISFSGNAAGNASKTNTSIEKGVKVNGAANLQTAFVNKKTKEIINNKFQLQGYSDTTLTRQGLNTNNSIQFSGIDSNGTNPQNKKDNDYSLITN